MKQQRYKELLSEIKELITGIPYPITNYANISAAIYRALPDINWAGFYLLEEDKMVLGPFQGNPACVYIPWGKGVCGTSLKEERTLIVADVEQFPGHIACDSASRSEIVIPMIKNGKAIGVLDIDSPIKNRFDETDKTYLEEIISILINSSIH
jgi:L-methionine (R)-S-oxide reductase